MTDFTQREKLAIERFSYDCYTRCKDLTYAEHKRVVKPHLDIGWTKRRSNSWADSREIRLGMRRCVVPYFFTHDRTDQTMKDWLGDLYGHPHVLPEYARIQRNEGIGAFISNEGFEPVLAATICHEFAHSVVCKVGDNKDKPHGAFWRRTYRMFRDDLVNHRDITNLS